MTDPVQFIDPMDAVISKLQPRDTRADQQPNPDEFKQTQEPIQPQQPVQPEPQPEPQKPAEPVNNDIKPEGEPKPEPFDLDKEIDDLLKLIKKEPTVPEVKPDVKPDVNTKPEKKIIKVPKILERDDNQELSVDEKEEITNYIYDLEDKLANYEFDKKRESVEKGQLEQMLEKERAKNNEVFDKLKELEREMKKAKSVQFPDELQTLIDYYKLNKDNTTLYNKRNLVWEASRIIEQITERPMDPYLLDWLKSSSYFNKETWGASMDMPKAEPKKDDWYNVMQF